MDSADSQQGLTAMEKGDELTCGCCQLKFNNVVSFILHKVTHVEAGRNSSCPLCGLAFSRQVTLREHLLRKHSVAINSDMAGERPGIKRRGRPPKREHPYDETNLNNQADDAVDSTHSTTGEITRSASEVETVHVVIDKIEDNENLSPWEVDKALEEKPVEEKNCTKVIEQNVSIIPKHDQSFVLCSATAQDKHVSSVSTNEHKVDQAYEVETSSDDPVEMAAEKSQVYQNGPLLSSTISANAIQEEPDADFLFILCTNHIKGNSFNYKKLGFQCFHCSFKTSWRNSLVRHMREKHPGMLAIHHCISIQNINSPDNQQIMKMSDYIDIHEHQRKISKMKRARGVEKQDLPGTHTCTKCNKVFGRLRYLRKHMTTHGMDKKHLCDECGKAFKTKAYLAAHRRTHTVKTYRCSQCDFTSTVNSLIHSHRQIHNDGSVLCDVCGYAYTDRATLKKHKLVHDENRPFPCTYPGCTWRFKTEVMCRAHFRQHTTPGRFTCSICNYTFRHKHHLQRHLLHMHSMDEATVYRTTNSQHVQDQMQAKLSALAKRESVEVVQEKDSSIGDTVSLIVNSDLSTEQLQSALESGQLVITTDEDNGTVNYEVADITMNVAYHALMDSEEAVSNVQAILIPHAAECSQIIFQHEPESTANAVVET